jgi:hypothetical protein
VVEVAVYIGGGIVDEVAREEEEGRTLVVGGSGKKRVYTRPSRRRSLVPAIAGQ